MCPSREPPPCVPASRRYRTHDGTCNNRKKPRWGAAQLPFHRFLAPDYTDGVEGIRRSINNSPLPSARFVSLVVHGSRQEEAPVTMMLALWGQLLDHDLTATAQPRSLNGSTPRCCGGQNDEGLHPSCLPIKVPLDDPWLSPLGVRCLEFLRSAPAQRRDCLLSWREQTNQVTSYIDASPIYSSNPRTSDNARIFRSGLLLFGRGPPSEDVCFRAALANQCIRPGDARSGEQPGLLMLHMVWVNEHNQIATELSDINPHWSDEKLYQETRRIVGAMFQHITYREFLPIILGKQVCQLFNLELESNGYYKGYDSSANPTVTNEFSAAAFRFGHSLIQGSYMRADRFHRFIPNNVTLHDESADGDLGGPGSLHRLVRGMVNQRALKRDEFITAELTNHLFQTSRFPFGLDLAAINIQRGRDHGIQPYINWRIPCGLTPIREWEDLDRVMGPASAHRLRKAYRFLDDIDLFVGGLAERPVVGGVVGPTFSCIIAQQFSNLRKGDRFWYENPGFESSFTPAQLDSIRQVAFSQVLCRALGGGTLQPHVFLPADIVQNERLACDSKLMAPIDLEPWTERDPFTRPNDVPNTAQSENLIDLNTVQTLLTTSSTTRRPTKDANVVNKVDFIPNGNVGLQIPSNGQIALNSLATSVHNKLDLSTTRPPTRPTIPTKEPMLTVATIINNKIDLTATTIPPPRKPTRKTTPKRRPTKPTVSTNLITNNLDFNFKRDTTANITDLTATNDNHTITKRDISYSNLSKLFTKEDNATLLPKKNTALRRGYYSGPVPAPPTDYDDVNNYDYNTDTDPPVFVKPGYGNEGPGTEQPPNTYYEQPPLPPLQPSYCVYNCYDPPMTTYNPYGLDTRRPARTTTRKRGLSNKIVNTNIEYGSNNKQKTQRPPLQRTTTPRTVFHRPGLIIINDNRPNDQPIFLSQSSSSPVQNSNVFLQNSKNPSSSTASQSVFSVDPRPQYSSRPIAHHQSVPSPNFFQKKTHHRKPLKELRTDQDRLPSKLISTLKQDHDYDSLVPDAERVETLNIHEHDGYLRPEQNKYQPLKKTSDLETYRNYSLFNVRDGMTMRNYEIPNNATLWTRTDSLRYAARYPQPLLDLDDDLDQFVRPYIYQDKIISGPDQSRDADETINPFIQLADSLKIEEQCNTTVTDKVDRKELEQDKLGKNLTDTEEPNVDRIAIVRGQQTDRNRIDNSTYLYFNKRPQNTTIKQDANRNDGKLILPKDDNTDNSKKERENDPKIKSTDDRKSLKTSQDPTIQIMDIILNDERDLEQFNTTVTDKVDRKELEQDKLGKNLTDTEEPNVDRIAIVRGQQTDRNRIDNSTYLHLNKRPQNTATEQDANRNDGKLILPKDDNTDNSKKERENDPKIKSTDDRKSLKTSQDQTIQNMDIILNDERDLEQFNTTLADKVDRKELEQDKLGKNLTDTEEPNVNRIVRGQQTDRNRIDNRAYLHFNKRPQNTTTEQDANRNDGKLILPKDDNTDNSKKERENDPKLKSTDDRKSLKTSQDQTIQNMDIILNDERDLEQFNATLADKVDRKELEQDKLGKNLTDTEEPNVDRIAIVRGQQTDRNRIDNSTYLHFNKRPQNTTIKQDANRNDGKLILPKDDNTDNSKKERENDPKLKSTDDRKSLKTSQDPTIQNMDIILNDERDLEQFNTTVTDKVDRKELEQDKLGKNLTDTEEPNVDRIAIVRGQQTDRNRIDSSTYLHFNKRPQNTATEQDANRNDGKLILPKDNNTDNSKKERENDPKLKSTDDRKSLKTSQDQTIQNMDIILNDERDLEQFNTTLADKVDRKELEQDKLGKNLTDTEEPNVNRIVRGQQTDRNRIDNRAYLHFYKRPQNTTTEQDANRNDGKLIVPKDDNTGNSKKERENDPKPKSTDDRKPFKTSHDPTIQNMDIILNDERDLEQFNTTVTDKVDRKELEQDKLGKNLTDTEEPNVDRIAIVRGQQTDRNRIDNSTYLHFNKRPQNTTTEQDANRNDSKLILPKDDNTDNSKKERENDPKLKSTDDRKSLKTSQDQTIKNMDIILNDERDLEQFNTTLTDKVDRKELEQDKFGKNLTDTEEPNVDRIVRGQPTDRNRIDNSTYLHFNKRPQNTTTEQDANRNDGKLILPKDYNTGNSKKERENDPKPKSTDDRKSFKTSQDPTIQNMDIILNDERDLDRQYIITKLDLYDSRGSNENGHDETSTTDQKTLNTKQKDINETDRTDSNLSTDEAPPVQTTKNSLLYREFPYKATGLRPTETYLSDDSTEINERKRFNIDRQKEYDEKLINKTEHNLTKAAINEEIYKHFDDKPVTDGNNNTTFDTTQRQRGTDNYRIETKYNIPLYQLMESVHEQTPNEPHYFDPTTTNDKTVLLNNFNMIADSVNFDIEDNAKTDLNAGPLDPTGPLPYADTYARTPLRDSIQSELSLEDSAADTDLENLSKLPRLEQLEDNRPNGPTSTERSKPERRTTNTPRRRVRPTHSKRPGHHQTANHGTNSDRRQPGIALVPFVLLTSIERPDNWVMFNVAKSKKRNPLPEVPQLKSELFSFSELPKPISAED
ncbi:uncharacterized protein LOC131677682 isoform X2 [Topomyia yanbarensis]|nr:uncharacterized protein LOC131677682 isoform X2 [Topomyia yanbarensis]